MRSRGRRVTRTGKDGVTEVLADNYEGKKLNSPNDISLDSKGRIYFTDPRYGRMDNLEIKDDAGKFIEGVYRIDAPGKITRILTHAVERPNGLLVSPDDSYLYVADNYPNRAGGARKLYRFGLKPDGSIVPDSRVLIFDWKTGARTGRVQNGPQRPPLRGRGQEPSQPVRNRGRVQRRNLYTFAGRQVDRVRAL